MQHLYVIMYDVGTVQNQSTAKFWQQITEFTFIGKTQLTAHAIFKTSLEVDLNSFRFLLTMKFVGLFNVLSIKLNLYRPNTWVAFQANEQPVELTSKLVYVFTPQCSRVLDRFPGPMYRSISCLQIAHQCTSIEQQKYCYDADLYLLRKYFP